jgi:hypothetical protein
MSSEDGKLRLGRHAGIVVAKLGNSKRGKQVEITRGERDCQQSV